MFTSLSLDFNEYCGGGAPRFNVTSDGTRVGNMVTFTQGNTYDGVVFPACGITDVSDIELVQDEQCTTTLSNIIVNGQR